MFFNLFIVLTFKQLLPEKESAEDCSTEANPEKISSFFQYSKLKVFLLGTIKSSSGLKMLRGQVNVLRKIWEMACSEWWSLHIQPFRRPFYLPRDFNSHSDVLDLMSETENVKTIFNRTLFAGSPLVLVANVTFPERTLEGHIDMPLAVNMMPFDLFDLEKTLPVYLHQYIPMIKQCRRYNKPFLDTQDTKEITSYNTKHFNSRDLLNRIAYLTVDERPVHKGESQRRGGIHVETLGAMRTMDIGDKSHYTPDLNFYHHWGHGWADSEFFIGGVFMASNTRMSTAVWNCRVHDTFGDVVGPLGSLERCRDLLGEPTKVLEAGELIWISDRTPHESLPLLEDANRQYFRLVIGEIAYWFADHNTTNPTGFSVPLTVPIVQGSKFKIAAFPGVRQLWESGDSRAIQVAREEAEFRKGLYALGVGFLADLLAKIGVYSFETFDERREMVKDHILSMDDRIYSLHMKQFIITHIKHIKNKNEMAIQFAIAYPTIV